MNAKYTAESHPWVCTNYAYWNAAKRFRDSLSDSSGYLFCDEGHTLSDTVLSYVGRTLDAQFREKYDLSYFPTISTSKKRSSSPFYPDISAQSENVALESAQEWLADSADRINRRWKNMLKMAPFTDPADRRRARRMELDLRSLTATIEAIDASPNDWYVKSGRKIIERWDYKLRRRVKMDALVCKPLTARHQFKFMFMSPSYQIAIMSATIGDFATFTTELGIESYASRCVPNQFSPSQRPVYILDAPRMGYKSTPADYVKQANVIAQAIHSCPRSWAGIIHVTRKTEAPKLKSRLIAFDIEEDRLWVPPEEEFGRRIGTQRQLELWEEYKRKVPNAIAIAWQFWEGFNGLVEKICIVAKVPFGFLGDEYEKARISSGTRSHSSRES
jgi:Rad3-related DNA helicase